jgi:hypothetical protein
VEILMKKRVVVEKSAFDSALSRMIKSKPVPRELVKIARKKPAKIIAPQN